MESINIKFQNSHKIEELLIYQLDLNHIPKENADNCVSSRRYIETSSFDISIYLILGNSEFYFQHTMLSRKNRSKSRLLTDQNTDN